MNKRILVIAAAIGAMVSLSGCQRDSIEAQQSKQVQRQQEQYNIGQPVPSYDWSLERHLLIQLYNIRNQRAATHAVWRSDYGQVEGDCPSMGYGLPYDTSLTNPLTATDEDQYGTRNNALASIGQAEPNGIFASTNTSATWVMCTGAGGVIEPVYVESKVTIYPYPVSVDYESNRVTKAGRSSVAISGGQ